MRISWHIFLIVEFFLGGGGASIQIDGGINPN